MFLRTWIPDMKKVPVPRFDRINLMETWNDNTIMSSSCAFVSGGIFCAHQTFVAKHVHDYFISQIYSSQHCSYAHLFVMYLAYKCNTPKPIKKLFEHLGKNKIQGPFQHIPITISLEISQSLVQLLAIKHLMSYIENLVVINYILFDGIYTSTSVPNELEFNFENI